MKKMQSLTSKVGFIGESLEAKLQFLRLAYDLNINTETDLHWIDSACFRGKSDDGKAFVELLNEDMLKQAVLAVADKIIAAPPVIASVIVSSPLGYGYFGGFRNSSEERRKRQFPLSGRDRRRQPHQY